ncbi:MAG: hypothetical protein HY739_13075 [Desulfobacterales bacterium]|nr:hypothetical protein [Desulfobacterales bacterium]
MKRLLMFKKRVKGKESQVIDLSLVRKMIGREGNNPAHTVRETTRIHALTGVPWEIVNREIEERR